MVPVRKDLPCSGIDIRSSTLAEMGQFLLWPKDGF